ncbi:hypothetical protein P4O66_013996 [Electrophorus voltai]|uniref:Claudin n=1 Tax=Electrophorus voltai TaxID=2609070 RepID=A0AAD8Z0W0_9TELE|nr:hypothetical protein P4O66_013996 [Electrophorus voltai]
MVSMCRQMLGFTLAIVGFLGTTVTCGLPMWKVTAFIGANIVTAQIIWEGLWMTCVMQSTGQMQCKIYDSMLALPRDLQAARALIIISIVVALLGIILGIGGGKCTNFVENESTKIKVAIASGAIFIVAGVLCLIPVCWSAQTIIMDFYNPLLTSAQKRELGASLYIGWGAAVLLILGGALLCSSCPPQDEKMPVYKIWLLGCILALIGWVGMIIVCTLPMWKVTVFISYNTGVVHFMWEGLWMSCMGLKHTGQMQCKVYDSKLALSTDLQAAQALVVVSLLVGLIGLCITFIAGKCTNFITVESSKCRMMLGAGVLLVISGILCLIPVSWSASTVIRDFYNPVMVDAQRRELGASLYIGWGAGLLMILGGALLCTSCPPRDDQGPFLKYQPLKKPSFILYSTTSEV